MSLSYEEWVLRAMDIEVPEGSHRPVEYPDGGFEGWIRREVLNVGARPTFVLQDIPRCPSVVVNRGTASSACSRRIIIIESRLIMTLDYVGMKFANCT